MQTTRAEEDTNGHLHYGKVESCMPGPKILHLNELGCVRKGKSCTIEEEGGRKQSQVGCMSKYTIK